MVRKPWRIFWGWMFVNCRMLLICWMFFICSMILIGPVFLICWMFFKCCMLFICWMFFYRLSIFMCWMLLVGQKISISWTFFIGWMLLGTWILSLHLRLHMYFSCINFQVELISPGRIFQHFNNHRCFCFCQFPEADRFPYVIAMILLICLYKSYQ